MASGEQGLKELGTEIQGAFSRARRVMSFDEYFKLASETPEVAARSAAQLVKGALDHYGTEEIKRPRGTVTRWKLFDTPWDGGKDRLIGQEEVQRGRETVLLVERGDHNREVVDDVVPLPTRIHRVRTACPPPRHR